MKNSRACLERRHGGIGYGLNLGLGVLHECGHVGLGLIGVGKLGLAHVELRGCRGGFALGLADCLGFGCCDVTGQLSLRRGDSRSNIGCLGVGREVNGGLELAELLPFVVYVNPLNVNVQLAVRNCLG